MVKCVVRSGLYPTLDLLLTLLSDIISLQSPLSLSQENTIVVVGKCFLNLGSAGAADLL